MYKYLSEEPRSKNSAGKVGVAGNKRSGNNHDNNNHHHHRRRHQQQQQQIERIKREIQIRAVISDDLDLDIEDDDDDEEDKDTRDDLENDSSEPSVAEKGEPVPGSRCQGSNSTEMFKYPILTGTNYTCTVISTYH